MIDEMINGVRGRLQLLDVHEVRKLCRHFGITLKSANQKKGELIDELINIAGGGELPHRSNKGAKPKSLEYNEVLAEEIEACRAAALGGAMQPKSEAETFGVERGAIKKEGFFDGDGVLLGGFSANHTPVNLLKMRYDIRVGDFIELGVDGGGEALEILKINGESPVKNRKNFADFVRVYPNTRISLYGDLTCKIVNICAPLALGQRAFIVGGPNTGKSTVLKSLLTGISGAEKIVLLVGAAPEEVTDFRRSGAGEVYFTTFEMPFSAHITAVKLISEHARRLAELSKDVVLAVDGLEILTRSQSQSALDELKRLLFTACNDENGGSVTVICTAETEGTAWQVSRLIDNRIALSDELVAKRVFPAIDMKNCFSERSDSFLTDREITAASKLLKIVEENGAEAALKLAKSAQGDLVESILKD